ncbi:COX15/CtaA family protein [Consotaella aegiceratis]|uniref:COX15/CtaA family protein n=1 Tax=Consotaella aegiceratis TaxID=3097961 RepID=UPI002F3E85BC
MTSLPTTMHPFDVRAIERVERNRRWVRTWLYGVALLIVALVLVGGATRLTNSGLSITEWKPIHGIVPPLSVEEWQEEFALYQRIPEYQEINQGMSLDAFKTIYWWEWTHRFLARAVGFVFAIPLVVFWAAGMVEPALKPRLVGIFLLGGLQGAIGWWMVASGLTERTDVSQYRLAVHLTTACVIFAYTLWVARGLAPHSRDIPPSPGSVWVAGGIVLLALVQIYLGGLVSGLDAGQGYNTWPLMDGQWVPDGLLAASPAWRNFFENAMTVQFDHRIGAYLLFLATALHAISAWFWAAGTTHARRALVLFVLIVLQATLGITTLLLHAPLGWALAHQAGAVVVLAFAVAHARGLRGSYPEVLRVEVRS